MWTNVDHGDAGALALRKGGGPRPRETPARAGLFHGGPDTIGSGEYVCSIGNFPTLDFSTTAPAAGGGSSAFPSDAQCPAVDAGAQSGDGAVTITDNPGPC